MVNVLALVSGLTEAMHCAFILERLHQKFGPFKATLLVYGASISMPDSLRTQTLSKAACFYPWHRSIDVCSETDAIRESNLRDRDEVVGTVRRKLGTETFDLILTHSSDKLPERAIFAALPAARIVLYDNGIQSHVDRAVQDDDNAWRQSGVVNAGDLRRIIETHFLLADVVGMPAYLQGVPHYGYSAAEYRERLDAAWSRVSGEADFQLDLDPNKPCHLLLGSAQHRSGKISYEQERELHLRHAASIIQQTDQVVIFKAKPRQHEKSYFEAEDRVRILRSHLPAEFVPLVFNVVGVSGLHSTALLTIPWLFGLPAIHISADHSPLMSIPHVQLLAEEVQRQQWGRRLDADNSPCGD